MAMFTYQHIVPHRLKAIVKGVGQNIWSTGALALLAAAFIYGAARSVTVAASGGCIAAALFCLAAIPAVNLRKVRRQIWAILRRQFAAQNSLAYYESKAASVLAILPLAIGSNHRFIHMVADKATAPGFWAATYVYEIKNLEAHLTIYVHALYITLARPLPQLSFAPRHTRQRNGKVFSRDQLIHIPDLDGLYTVHAPVACHEAINAILTPEIRENLLKLDGQYTIEVIGHDLYITRGSPPKATVGRLMLEVETLYALKQAFETATSRGVGDAAARLRQDNKVLPIV